MKLYRGTRIQQDTLYPQPIPEGDLKRFPSAVDKVVFATSDPVDAEIYAAFRGVVDGPFWSHKDANGKWHVSIPMSAAKLEQLEGKTIYIYEIDGDAGDFQKMPDGDEYYSVNAVKPTGCKEKKLKDVFAEWKREGKVQLYFQEVEREIQPLKG